MHHAVEFTRLPVKQHGLHTQTGEKQADAHQELINQQGTTAAGRYHSARA
jgi:hypothetical protein